MVKYFEQSYRVSERHACCVLELARATYRYEGHQEQWIELRMRIREIAQTRVRYGYRMIRVLLNREGWKSARTSSIGCTRRKGWGCASDPLEEDGPWCIDRSASVQPDRTRSGPWTSLPINSAMEDASAR